MKKAEQQVNVAQPSDSCNSNISYLYRLAQSMLIDLIGALPFLYLGACLSFIFMVAIQSAFGGFVCK